MLLLCGLIRADVPKTDAERVMANALTWQNIQAFETQLTGASDQEKLRLLTSWEAQYSTIPNERSQDLVNQGLTLARQLHDTRAEAFSLLNLGLLQVNLGQFAVAQEHFFQSLRCYEAIPSPPDIAWLNIHIANLFRFGFNDYITPLLYYARAETISRKVSNPVLREDLAQDILHRLIELMDREKPYLDPKITLQSLAEKLDVNRNYLSSVINDLLGKGFNELINDCRTEIAKQLLIERDFSRTSILDVAYDAGFNSKSAFNRIFKASTGVTPREYRAQVLSDKESQTLD